MLSITRSMFKLLGAVSKAPGRLCRRRFALCTALVLSCWLAISIGACATITFPRVAGPEGACPEAALAERRRVAATRGGISESWRRGGVRIPYSDIPTAVVASEHTVVVITCEDNQGFRLRLSGLDITTGSTRWISAPLSSVQGLAANEKTILAVTDWRLRAYDVDNGTTIWQTEELPSHARYRIHPIVGEEATVYWIDDTRGQWIQVVDYYDVETGVLVDEDRIPTEPDRVLALRSSIVDFWTGPGVVISASPRNAHEDLWSVAGNEKLRLWPHLIGDQVAFSSGIFPILEARDAISGSVAWTHNTPLVSNVDMSRPALYAIEQTASIVTIDALSGRSLELVRMAQQLTESETRSIGFWVSVTEQMILAYYGDSQELIAFNVGVE